VNVKYQREGKRGNMGSYLSLIFLGRGRRGRRNPHPQQAGPKILSSLNVREKVNDEKPFCKRPKTHSKAGYDTSIFDGIFNSEIAW
jgi:hypothetical protein